MEIKNAIREEQMKTFFKKRNLFKDFVEILLANNPAIQKMKPAEIAELKNQLLEESIFVDAEYRPVAEFVCHSKIPDPERDLCMALVPSNYIITWANKSEKNIAIVKVDKHYVRHDKIFKPATIYKNFYLDEELTNQRNLLVTIRVSKKKDFRNGTESLVLDYFPCTETPKEIMTMNIGGKVPEGATKARRFSIPGTDKFISFYVLPERKEITRAAEAKTEISAETPGK